MRNENVSQAKFSISQAKFSLRGRRRSSAWATPRYERCAFSSSAAVHPGPTSADNHRRRRLDARIRSGEGMTSGGGAAQLGNFWASPYDDSRRRRVERLAQIVVAQIGAQYFHVLLACACERMSGEAGDFGQTSSGSSNHATRRARLPSPASAGSALFGVAGMARGGACCAGYEHNNAVDYFVIRCEKARRRTRRVGFGAKFPVPGIPLLRDFIPLLFRCYSAVNSAVNSAASSLSA